MPQSLYPEFASLHQTSKLENMIRLKLEIYNL